MSDKDTQEIFDGIMEGLEEGIRFNKGEDTGAKVKRIKLVFKPAKVYTPEQIKHIRANLNLSQPDLAALLSVSVDTLRRWEQGLNPVSGGNSRMLELLELNKEQVLKAFELKGA